mgnify:CR=1 FL=1
MLKIATEAIHHSNYDEAFQGAVTLDALLAFAKQLKTNFAIEGSLARSIFASWDDNVTGDVCTLIGPLSDIDLLCEPKLAVSLVKALQNAFPILKFFHIETRPPPLSGAPYQRSGNIKLTDPPEIWFMGNDKRLDLPNHGNVYEYNGRNLPKPPTKATSIEWLKSLEKTSEVVAYRALLDILFLLRQNLKLGGDDEPDEIVQKLVNAYKRASGESLRLFILGDPVRSRQIRMALLKCLSAHHSQSALEPPEDLLTILKKLSDTMSVDGGQTIKTLAELSHEKKPVPFQAIVVPKHFGGRWCRDVESITLESTSGAELINKVSSQQEKAFLVKMLEVEGVRLSPTFGLQTADPPDPHCCDYYDFSRGHAEAIWSGNPGIQDTSMEMYEQQLTPIVSSKFDEVALTHSYQYVGAVNAMNSVRLDFGHLCALAGVSQHIDFVAVRRETLPQSENQPSQKERSDG